MTDFIQLSEGMSLGEYTLEQRTGEDTFAVISAAGERLLMKVAGEEDPRFAIWDRSRHLHHQHLLPLREAGLADRYAFAVFESPDDVLATALENGPLTEEETLGVLQAVLAALRYLHGQGMVHGAVDPAHIFAVGDTVKLSSDDLRELDDLEGHLEDIRQLGELVRTMRSGEELSEVLATVVEHATVEEPRQRWTLAEIAMVLEPKPAPVVVAVDPAPPIPVVPTEPEPVVDSVQAAPVAMQARSPLPFPKWIFAVAGGVLLGVVLFHPRSKPSAAAPPAPVVVVPKAVVSAPSSRPPAAAATPAQSGTWRVIAFTYHSHDLAAKKATKLNKKWPDLHAVVFAPKGLRGWYFVSLGDGMDHDQATRVQHRARGLGLPRDTFVQSYSE